ncbi:MAG: class I SAM-dependent methyltransferase [Phycisphaerae bacterium]
MAVTRPKPAFDHCADDYSQYRPTYPDGVLDLIAERAGPPAGRWAADVGAGTGIFTRLLARGGWRVLAVEPSLSMLGRFESPGDDRQSHPPIERLCASAEATALKPASISLVTAAQAFHWFNPPYALAEFARILEPGGLLMLLWNNRDDTTSPFARDYETLIAQYNPAYQHEYRRQDWPAKIAKQGDFEPARPAGFAHTWQLTADAFIGFTRSTSYIRNVLSAEQRPRFENDVRSLIQRHFGDGLCEIPMNTQLWTARRR